MLAKSRTNGRTCVWKFGHLLDPCDTQVDHEVDLNVKADGPRFLLVSYRGPRGDTTFRHKYGRTCVWRFGHLADPCKTQVGHEVDLNVKARTPRARPNHARTQPHGGTCVFRFGHLADPCKKQVKNEVNLLVIMLTLEHPREASDEHEPCTDPTAWEHRNEHKPCTNPTTQVPPLAILGHLMDPVRNK